MVHGSASGLARVSLYVSAETPDIGACPLAHHGSAVSEIPTQVMHEGFDFRGITAPGLRPFIHPSPPVLARRAGEPRQQVDMQVRHFITNHGRVDMLCASHVPESPARARVAAA
jgi:hypothetical protein